MVRCAPYDAPDGASHRPARAMQVAVLLVLVLLISTWTQTALLWYHRAAPSHVHDAYMSDQQFEIIQGLTPEEEAFALAVVEHNGNLGLAYTSVFGEHRQPNAQGKRLLERPMILARVLALQQVVQESVLISMTAHLVELADIRDRAKMANQLKVALEAERMRGEAVGFYKDRGTAPDNLGVVARDVIRAALSVEGAA